MRYFYENKFCLQLWSTQDFGRSWDQVEMNVKSYFWVTMGEGDKASPRLVVERLEPFNESTVIVIPENADIEHARPQVLIENVQDLRVNGNFMFATKRADKVSFIFLRHSYKCTLIM